MTTSSLTPKDAALKLLSDAYVSLSEPLDLDKHNDEYWLLLDKIKKDRETALEDASTMIESDDPIERYYGYTLSGQLFNPTEDDMHDDAAKMIDRLTRRINDEKDVSCLAAIAFALSHPYMHEAETGLLKLAASDNGDIRFAATTALGSTSVEIVSDEWIETTIRLMKDEDEEIRDWATTNMAGVESEDIRIVPALIRQLGDKDIDIRSEALHGLAYRDEEAAYPALIKLLEDGPVSPIDIESAGLFGRYELLPLLEGYDTNDHLINWARKRCAPSEVVRNSVDDEWLGDEAYLSVEQGHRRALKTRDGETIDD